MKHRINRIVLRTLMTGVLGMSCAAYTQTSCTSSTPGKPCFTHVSDFLNGVRSILPNDDISFLGPNTSGSFGTSLSFATSSNLSFSAPSAKSSSTHVCALSRGVRARFFNTPTDWYAVLVGNNDDPACGHSASLVWEDASKPANLNPQTGITLTSVSRPSELHIINADVNQDGFEDAVVYSTDRVRVFTAVNVNNPGEGLKQVVDIPIHSRVGQLVAGDLNGDGATDLVLPVARPDPDNSRYQIWDMDAFSVCPGAGFTLLSGSVDPAYPPYHCQKEWEVYQRGSGVVAPAAFGYTSPYRRPQDTISTVNEPRLAVGQFLGVDNGRVQLFADVNETRELFDWCPNYYSFCFYRSFQTWMFDAALRPTLISTKRFGSGSTYPTDPEPHDILRSGRLHASGRGSDRDQIVLMASRPPDLSRMQIITLDENGRPELHGDLRLDPAKQTVAGMEVGRFDPPGLPGGPDYNNQIAVLTSSPSGTTLLAYRTDQNWSINLASQRQMGPGINYGSYGALDRLTGMLHAVDTQGRSALLGSPYKVVLDDHYQPTLVLGIPPMHIDYITDSNNRGPAVTNLTVWPSSTSKTAPAFNTQYSFASELEARHEDGEQTDYSHSFQASSDNSIYFGSDDIKKANLALTITAAGASAYKKSEVEKKAQYQKIQRTVDVTSGFSDYVYFKASRLNLYSYPIIGRRCSDYTQNCPAAEKLQRYLQFSAPDEIEDLDLDGTTQQWYQPVQESGNVFSYPWDLEQMELRNPTLSPVKGQSNSWTKTDTALQSVKTTWATGSSSAETTGEVNKWNIDTSLTVTGRKSILPWPFSKLGNIETTNAFKYGYSNSIESQTTDTLRLDASTGVQVNKPGFSDQVARQYFYYFTSYILGTTTQLPSLTPVPTILGANGEPVDQQFFGPLVVSYAADPFHDSSQAPWWRRAYTKPDIGLSHPERWSWNKDTKTASFNYRQSSTEPLVTLSDPFFHMKGLFIGEASDDPNSSPNLSSATAGDVLRLQARIYNFSVADMPAGSHAKARFYGQIYDPSRGSLSGDGFLIGESSVAAIPGFHSTRDSGQEPNWELASTEFNTSDYAGKLLVFWVVTWAEDASGNMLEEQPGHGLQQNPSALSFRQITEVPVDDYSNNVGMFGVYTPFAVLPKKIDETTPRGDVHRLQSNDVLLQTTPVARESGRSEVTVTVHNTSDGCLISEPVILYDGDPDLGGKAFDVQRIPYLERDGMYVLHTFIHPDNKGPHTLYVRVGWNDRTAPEMATTVLTVP